MTAVCAVRKEINGKFVTVFGSDGLFSTCDRKCRHDNTGKIVKFNDFVVLFSGSAAVQHPLIRFSKSKCKSSWMKMRDSEDVLSFYKQINQMLRVTIEDLGAPMDDASDFSLLIATKDTIYTCDRWGFVTEHSDFASGGSGGDILLGGLAMAYDAINSEEMMVSVVNKALEVTCSLLTSCGAPIVVGKI